LTAGVFGDGDESMLLLEDFEDEESKRRRGGELTEVEPLEENDDVRLN
jgi:hypothetical protein